MNGSKRIKYYIKKNMPKCCYPFLIELQYYKKKKYFFDFNNPKTFCEKIQWAKLCRRDAIFTHLTDKIAVRDYVREKIGNKYLVPLIGGIYNDSEDIDFEKLPNEFVIKTNHGCGCNIIVLDKSRLDVVEVKKKIRQWINHNYAYDMFELQYKDIVPKIYIERNLLSVSHGNLADYKFFCFNGKVFCIYVMTDGYPDHSKSKLGIFDRNFNLMDYRRKDFCPIDKQLDKPINYDHMVEIAEKLSEGFSHVRVDLYNIEGNIYFGEMTFTTGGGYFEHVPEEFDTILGEQWNLNSGL
ncbi:ATP-grasp fold amidoligase family protein [Butyrivibrio hungatei]|uniref:ATP-grasp fold amidoligase family protein n=1 Tax=Butyrivibrio hungatei TaxID=185008 RepID=UPI000401475E|nr:ATP-grasp fold amidoligase family protein [Butyrivibrio hungatei]